MTIEEILLAITVAGTLMFLIRLGLTWTGLYKLKHWSYTSACVWFAKYVATGVILGYVLIGLYGQAPLDLFVSSLYFGSVAAISLVRW